MMRTARALAACGLGLLGLAAAARAQVGALPHAFAGYAQPAIPATACKTQSATEVQCIVPAMTAGRYLIEAAGTSTAQGAGASQAMEIDVGPGQCGVGRDTASWPSGPRTFRLNCEVIFLADVPVTIRVVYSDTHAIKDPKGPIVSVRPLPWVGLLYSQAFAPRQ